MNNSQKVKNPHTNIKSNTQFIHNKNPPKHTKPKKIHNTTNPNKTYKQQHQKNNLYKNTQFYKKQTIYN